MWSWVRSLFSSKCDHSRLEDVLDDRQTRFAREREAARQRYLKTIKPHPMAPKRPVSVSKPASSKNARYAQPLEPDYEPARSSSRRRDDDYVAPAPVYSSYDHSSSYSSSDSSSSCSSDSGSSGGDGGGCGGD